MTALFIRYFFDFFFEDCCETYNSVNRISFAFAKVTNGQRLIYATSFPGLLALLFSKSSSVIFFKIILL